MKEVLYEDIRETIQTGDLIAFGGKGFLSDGIKGFIQSSVSHVGVALRTAIIAVDGMPVGSLIICVESTSLDGFKGVIGNQLSLRIKQYDGDIWLLPLSTISRHNLNKRIGSFVDFLLRQDHIPYDYLQAIRSPFGKQSEDWSRWFCSELVAAGYEHAGLLSTINCSIVTPKQLCQVSLFADEYYQIKGTSKSIDGYNSVSIDTWCQAIQEQ